MSSNAWASKDWRTANLAHRATAREIDARARAEQMQLDQRQFHQQSIPPARDTRYRPHVIGL